MKTHTSMNTNILGEEMAFEATKVPRNFLDDQLIIWKERRDLLYVGLKDAGLELWNPEGAFYMLPKIDNAADFVWGQLSTPEFAEQVISMLDAGVPVEAIGRVILFGGFTAGTIAFFVGELNVK